MSRRVTEDATPQTPAVAVISNHVGRVIKITDYMMGMVVTIKCDRTTRKWGVLSSRTDRKGKEVWTACENIEESIKTMERYVSNRKYVQADFEWIAKDMAETVKLHQVARSTPIKSETHVRRGKVKV